LQKSPTKELRIGSDNKMMLSVSPNNSTSNNLSFRQNNIQPNTTRVNPHQIPLSNEHVIAGQKQAASKSLNGDI